MRESCYGSLHELNLIDTSQESSIFYVKPDGLNSDEGENHSLLRRGEFVDCGTEVKSILNQTFPWTIPRGMRLFPSCTVRQTLVRQSGPSEDVEHVDNLHLAKTTLSDHYTPCALVRIDSSDVQMHNFDMDNSACVSFMKNEHRLTYLSAVVNIYASSRRLSNVSICGLQMIGSNVAVHLTGMSTHFPLPLLHDVSLKDIGGGRVIFDLVCGEVTVENADDIIVIPSPENICRLTLPNEGVTIIDVGPRTMSTVGDIMMEGKGEIRENCGTFHVAVIALSLFLLLALLALCLGHMFGNSDMERLIQEKNK